MKIRNKANGGLAEVTDEYGQKLIALGSWVAADAPKQAPRKQSPRQPRKAAQKPAEAPETN